MRTTVPTGDRPATDLPGQPTRRPRYRSRPAGALHWSRLGEDEPEEVVVFDAGSGATHRVDATALEVHELLSASAQGLQCATIAACLLHPGLAPFGALRRYRRTTPAAQRSEELRLMSGWLDSWQRSGLLLRCE